MRPIEAQVEDAIIACVKTASESSGFGYRLAEIESYGGQFDEEIGETVRRLPGVWVTYAGSAKASRHSTQRDAWLMPMTFAVMVGARNLRNERSTRHGVSVDGRVKEPGVYQMLADVRQLLAGHDLALPIAPLEPGAVRTLYNTRLNNAALAVFVQEWHTQCIVRRASDEADAPVWLRAGLNYHLAPDDGRADASDLLTLR